MKYQDYVNLGFKRTDMNDAVEYANTGFYGYCLERQVNEKILVSVSGGELDTPKLYIKKRNHDSYHIIKITSEIVRDLLSTAEDGIVDVMTTAC